MKTLLVKIHTYRRIPFLSCNGPILTPIKIDEKVYKELTKLGIEVEIVEPIELKPYDIPVHKESEEPVVVPEEEEIVESVVATPEETEEKEEAIKPTDVIETEDEELPDAVVETVEIELNDENLSAEAFYEKDFLTKNKAITILTNREVEFDSKANAKTLIQLVLDTNPEVA